MSSIETFNKSFDISQSRNDECITELGIDALSQVGGGEGIVFPFG